MSGCEKIIIIFIIIIIIIITCHMEPPHSAKANPIHRLRVKSRDVGQV